MYWITQLFLFILCCLMFKVSREYKVAILLLSTICLDAVVLNFVPFGGSHYILSHCFILSEIPYIRQHIKTLKKTIIYPLLLIAIIAAIVLLINSPHYNNNLTNTLRLFITELTGKYFAICYAFISIRSMDNMKPVLKVSYYSLLILTAFGVLNFVTGRAWFIDTIGAHMTVAENWQDLGGKFTNSERFRVQAMFFNPFNYGYICILLLLLQLWGYVKKLVSKQQFYISVVCSIFGVLFCGCRTNILCCAIGIVVFVYYAYSMKQWIRYAIVGFFLCIIAYSTVPIIQEKVDQTLTAFDANSQTSGSSIDMRLLQYTAVLYHIRDHELFGRGLGFFNIDMGWGEAQMASLVDKDLYGLEGVVMSYLLERGIIGLLLYLAFYATILYFLYRHRVIDKQTSAFGLSLVFAYLAFANMTGELNSVFPTLLLIGCCIKLLRIYKVQKREEYYKESIAAKNVSFH